MSKKLRLLGGGRKREDIYDKCKKTGYIDIDGEYREWGEQVEFFPESHYGSEEEDLRLKAKIIVNRITRDPIERLMAKLMIDYRFSEVEVAEIILGKGNLKSMNVSLARVKWFMRKIEGWKKKKLKETHSPSRKDSSI